MSSGKEAARDLRYGRRGGRWAGADAGHVGEVLDDVQRIRLAALREDATKPPDELADPRRRSWPSESLELWREIAADPSHPQHELALEVLAAAGDRRDG